MSDDKGKGVKATIADEAKAAAVEVYRDLAKPVVAPIGQVAGAAINFVLWPVKLALDSANTQLGKLSARVAKKLETVPPERQLPAPATIAGPAALQYALLGDGDEVSELRELFETLLAKSMDIETRADVHPAFVGMVSQMTPDEARILKSITQGEHAASHVQDFDTNPAVIKNAVSRGFRTLLGRDIGVDESRIPQYISNLARLGILRIDWSLHTDDEKSYESIKELVEVELGNPPGGRLLRPGVILVTPLGADFLATGLGVHVALEVYS